MAMPFRPAEYLTLPVVDVPTTLTFGHKILASAPAKVPPAVKKALGVVERATTTLQSSWTDADRAGTTDRRPIDHAADVAWGAMRDRLESYGRLPGERYPHAARARELDASLFTSGVAFLGAEYDVQWAEMHKRVQRILEEDLKEELERLCGVDLITELLRTYHDYGRMVGAIGPRVEESKAASLYEQQRVVVNAATDYALQLIAWHQDGDDAAKAEVRSALVPFDELREGASRARRGAAGQDSAPDKTTSPTPAPPGPAPVGVQPTNTPAPVSPPADPPRKAASPT